MKYIPPVNGDTGNADRPWINADPANGIEGAIPDGAGIEHPQRELVNFITLSGLTPSEGDLQQVARAVRSQRLNYFVAGGSGSALTATLLPAPPSYESLYGVQLRGKITAENPGSITLNINGLGALPVYSPGAADLLPGTLMVGDLADFICVGTAFVLVSSTGAAQSRIATLYVRTNGNDNNNGSQNDAAHAFATIGAAVAYGLSRYSLNGSDRLTIQLGNAGTYAEPGNIYGARSPVHVVGDPAHQGDYIIAGANPAGSGALIAAAGGTTLLVSGLKLRNTGTTVANLGAVGNSSVAHANVTFESTVATGKPHIFATQGGSITTQDGNIISGFAASAFTSQSGFITIVGTVTMSGNPDFSQATAVATDGGAIIISGGSISGAATGKRFSAAMNGTINTSGGGANFFPGNVPGDTASGGQYA